MTEAAYRFGSFELCAAERVLKHNGAVVALEPKALDALICLVTRAQRLVSKQELMATLWPTVHVSDANLTNTISSLRKIVGREAIRTVSKYGYRFELAVTGEPGVAADTYAKFTRAKEFALQRSLTQMMRARDLLWTCIAEDPGFAPAWAWLGRCSWFLYKFSESHAEGLDSVRAAFERAFKLDSDLAVAHQFFTHFQVDTGQAELAMARLLNRLRVHPDEPETLAGLVHVLRFQGLLEHSLVAHSRAVLLDPGARTSVAHTIFLMGDYPATIQAYDGRAGYYLDAAAWSALGEDEQAAKLLRQRLEELSLSHLMTSLMQSLLALLEGRAQEASRLMEAADTSRDPEISVYFARHYARMGNSHAALESLRKAIASGFICSPHTLQSDEWLQSARSHPAFVSLLQSTESLVSRSLDAREALHIQLGED